MQPVCVHQPGHSVLVAGTCLAADFVYVYLSDKSPSLEGIKKATVFRLYIPTRMLTLKVCFLMLLKINKTK